MVPALAVMYVAEDVDAPFLLEQRWVVLQDAAWHHQVRVAVAQDTLDAEFLGKPEALHKGFVLGDVVGDGEVDLECVAESVTFWR